MRCVSGSLSTPAHCARTLRSHTSDIYVAYDSLVSPTDTSRPREVCETNRASVSAGIISKQVRQEVSVITNAFPSDCNEFKKTKKTAGLLCLSVRDQAVKG